MISYLVLIHFNDTVNLSARNALMHLHCFFLNLAFISNSKIYFQCQIHSHCSNPILHVLDDIFVSEIVTIFILWDHLMPLIYSNNKIIMQVNPVFNSHRNWNVEQILKLIEFKNIKNPHPKLESNWVTILPVIVASCWLNWWFIWICDDPM